jgi:dephospho-CoA kinase
MPNDSTEQRPATIVLAGPTCAGKTTLAHKLSVALGWPIVSARSAIQTAGGLQAPGRQELVRSGMQLELDNPGHWLVEATDRTVGHGNPAIIDAARTHAQIEALRGRPPLPRVVYVRADRGTRERRFEEQRDREETMSFSDLASSRAEIEAEEVIGLADLRIDTTYASSEEVACQVAQWLRSAKDARAEP